MRYEVMRLLQFVFSLGLVFVAFMGGVFVGWRRWGRPVARPVDHARPLASTPHRSAHDGEAARRDLFAPEGDSELLHPVVDLTLGAAPERLELPTGDGMPLHEAAATLPDS